MIWGKIKKQMNAPTLDFLTTWQWQDTRNVAEEQKLFQFSLKRGLDTGAEGVLSGREGTSSHISDGVWPPEETDRQTEDTQHIPCWHALPVKIREIAPFPSSPFPGEET